MHHKNNFFVCIYSHKNNNNPKKSICIWVPLIEQIIKGAKCISFQGTHNYCKRKKKTNGGKKLRKVCVYGRRKPLTQDACRNTSYWPFFKLPFCSSSVFLYKCFCEKFFLSLLFFLAQCVTRDKCLSALLVFQVMMKTPPNLSQTYLMLQAIN